MVGGEMVAELLGCAEGGRAFEVLVECALPQLPRGVRLHAIERLVQEVHHVDVAVVLRDDVHLRCVQIELAEWQAEQVALFFR